MKTIVGIINFDSILLAKANPNEGNQSAQEPNQDTQGPELNFNNEDENEPNLTKSGIRDVTASSNMRARSHHSSTPLGAKGDSVKSSQQK